MTHWLIVKTDFRKEHHVARQIELLGFPAWVPSQLIAVRKRISRQYTQPAVALKELPILPKRLFAAVPEHVQLGIRHFAGFEQTAEQRPAAIPEAQIMAFRAEIDRENTAALALANARSKRTKARWKSLHDALLEMVEAAKHQMERAA